MSKIRGNGMICVWTNINHTVEEEFNTWYDEEHIPERINEVSGIISACRYRSIDGNPKYLAVYNLEEPSVLDSTAYKEVSARKSPGTEMLMPNFLDTVRNIYSELLEVGTPPDEDAEYLLSVRLNVDPQHDELFNAWYGEDHLPALVGVEGIHYARRFKAVEGAPPYLALYEMADPEIMETEAWQNAADYGRTPEIRPHFKDLDMDTYKLIFSMKKQTVRLAGPAYPHEHHFGDIKLEPVQEVRLEKDIGEIKQTAEMNWQGNNGVRYVLESSVQKTGGRVRITAQLVDANTGNHLWAYNYDRDLKDIFVLQDKITREIVVQLQVELTKEEGERIWFKGMDNFETWANARKVKEYLFKHSTENTAKAKKLINKAIELDPEFVEPYGALVGYHHILSRYKQSKSHAESLERSNELLQKAIVLDDSVASAYSVFGYNLMLMGKYDQAIRRSGHH